MINRIRKQTQEPEEKPPANDYYEVVTDLGSYYVARETAQRIAQQLARRWPPRWLCFTDVFDAVLRIRTRTITAVCESRDEQRRNEREFWRARKRERKDGREPWEDDDWC